MAATEQSVEDGHVKAAPGQERNRQENEQPNLEHRDQDHREAERHQEVGRFDHHDRDPGQRQGEIVEDRLEPGHDVIEHESAHALHAQQDEEDVCQPGGDAGPDWKLARAGLGGDPQGSGKHPGGLADPGKQGRITSDEPARAFEHVRQRGAPVQPRSDVHDSTVVPAPVVIGERGDRRRQRHPALGGDRQDVQERVLLRRRPPRQDHHAAHGRDKTEKQQAHDHDHDGEDRAGDDYPQPEQHGHGGDQVHEMAEPPRTGCEYRWSWAGSTSRSKSEPSAGFGRGRVAAEGLLAAGRLDRSFGHGGLPARASLSGKLADQVHQRQE